MGKIAQPKDGIAFQAIAPVRSGLVDAAYEQLTKLIMTGEIGPETRLTEKETSEGLGISRTPLREAFRRLEVYGMIERDGAGGYVVARWDSHKLWELTTWRGALESLAMRLLAENFKKEDRDYLEDVVEEMEVFSTRGRYDALIALDMKFHSYIWSQTGHRRLIQALNDTKLQIQYVMLITRPGDEYRYPEMHQTLIDALGSGDPERAEAEMRAHVADTARMAGRVLGTNLVRKFQARTAG